MRCFDCLALGIVRGTIWFVVQEREPRLETEKFLVDLHFFLKSCTMNEIHFGPSLLKGGQIKRDEAGGEKRCHIHNKSDFGP